MLSKYIPILMISLFIGIGKNVYMCAEENAQFWDNFSDGTFHMISEYMYKDHTTCSNIVFCHIKHIPWWHSILTSIYMTISKQYIVWNDKIKTHSNFTPIRENNVVLQNIGEGCCTYIDQIHWKHIKYIDFWWFIINVVQKDDLIFKKNLDILYNEWYNVHSNVHFLHGSYLYLYNSTKHTTSLSSIIKCWSMMKNESDFVNN